MKNLIKKNQLMITALAIMIAIAGYLQFAGDNLEEDYLTVEDGIINEVDSTGVIAENYTAEELAEETFFRLITRRPGFLPKYSFKTWLYAIGRNTALNHLKRAGRIQECGPEELARMRREEDDLERAYLRQEQRIVLHREIAALKQEYSAVLYLKYFEELDNGAIGKIMKKNKRQIENLLYQAKGALKARLEKEGFVYEEL